MSDREATGPCRSRRAGRSAAGATVKLGGRTLRFRTTRSALTAGAGRTLRLTLRKADLRPVQRALRGGRRLTARVTATATDVAGNRAGATRAVRLTR